MFTKNKYVEKELGKTNPTTIASKKMKYLGINLIKEVESLYSSSFEMLKKEI